MVKDAFTDTVGLLSAPQDQQIRRFTLDNGMLLACAAEKGLYGTVTVICHDKPPVCRLMTMHPEPVDAAYTATTTEVGTEGNGASKRGSGCDNSNGLISGHSYK